MANDFMTTTDMIADALDLSGAELNELREAAPLMAALPAHASSDGTSHKYIRYTQSPVVGFRAENAGRDFDKSVDSPATVALKLLDFSWACDKAVADAWRQGGASAFIAREGLRHLQAALWQMETQYINGGAGGFDGLLDQDGTNGLELDALAGATVITAGGTTVASQTSVYFLRVNSDECSMIVRGDGAQLGDTITQNMLDGSGLNYPAYYTPACTWVAGQFGAKYSAGRLANVEATLTDDMIYEVLAQFPAGQAPNMIVMNKTAQELLRSSRTATNTVGAPAPMVDSVAGIRVLTSDAVLNTEAVVA